MFWQAGDTTTCRDCGESIEHDGLDTFPWFSRDTRGYDRNFVCPKDSKRGHLPLWLPPVFDPEDLLQLERELR